MCLCGNGHLCCALGFEGKLCCVRFKFTLFVSKQNQKESQLEIALKQAEIHSIFNLVLEF